MGLTVVVPTFNSSDHIYACLSSVRRCLPDAEVIVVDNGSTDETCEVVRQGFPAAVILEGHGNVGFGRACNLAAKHASSEYVLYLNPDAELVSVDQDTLATLARSRPFGMVAAMVSQDEAPPRPTLRRQSDHWLAEFVAVRLLAILSPYAPRLRYVEQADGRGTYTVGGAVFLVAVDEFRSLGGFDERFFMYYEDTDLTQRYLRRGHPLRASPALLATHVGGGSAPTPRRLALGFLGWLEYVDKWHGTPAAMRAATVARTVYSLLVSVLGLIAKVTGNMRVRAKAEQLSAMLSDIATEGFDASATDPHPRYPTAAPITKCKFRSFVLDDAGRVTP
jgi:hypothetical protein